MGLVCNGNAPDKISWILEAGLSLGMFVNLLPRDAELLVHFYKWFLFVPYIIMRSMIEPLHLRHHQKSLCGHMSDLVTAMFYIFVLFKLENIGNKAELCEFMYGTCISMALFCLFDSYGPIKNFTFTFPCFNHIFSNSGTFIHLAPLTLAIILVGYASCESDSSCMSSYIDNTTLFKILIPLGYLSLRFITCPCTDVIHIHHWQIFFTASTLLAFNDGDSYDLINISMISGLFYGCFLQGITMFGFDSLVELKDAKT